MNLKPTLGLALIGCGSVFDSIRVALPRIAATDRAVQVITLASTETAAAEAGSLLATLDAAEVRVFIAIDHFWLNHVRLETYAAARLRGFKCETLRHPQTICEPDIRVGENCWIGAGAVIGTGVRIGNNTFVGASARIDAGAQIGANAWIGPGAAIGQHARIGAHCLIGADVKIRADVVLGRHCSIDVPNAYGESLPDGTFIDPLFALPVRIFGNAGVRSAD